MYTASSQRAKLHFLKNEPMCVASVHILQFSTNDFFGGGLVWDHRDAAIRGDEDVSRDQTNLLDILDNDAKGIGSTEMDFNVQLPSCHVPTKLQLSPQSRVRGRISATQQQH